MTREQIENDVEVTADNFMSDVFDLYQCSARGDISWDDLLDVALIKIMDAIARSKDFDWEED